MQEQRLMLKQRRKIIKLSSHQERIPQSSQKSRMPQLRTKQQEDSQNAKLRLLPANIVTTSLVK